MLVAADHTTVLLRQGNVDSVNHAEAVLAYARHYGGLGAAEKASLVAVRAEAMELDVDGAKVTVPFDHCLSDSEDAHRTLVAMLRALPR